MKRYPVTHFTRTVSTRKMAFIAGAAVGAFTVFVEIVTNNLVMEWWEGRKAEKAVCKMWDQYMDEHPGAFYVTVSPVRGEVK